MAPRVKPKPELGPHFLRAWRDKLGVRQVDAAEAISVSRELLSKIENSKSPYLQQHLEGLARLYRRSPAELLSVDPETAAAPVSSETEILRFLARIDGLNDLDISIAFGAIKNARDAKRASPEPSGSHDPQQASNPRHAPEPSGLKARLPSS